MREWGEGSFYVAFEDGDFFSIEFVGWGEVNGEG